MPRAIVTSTYRYKRPPRKRKAVPLAGPAIVATRAGQLKTEPVAVAAPPPVNDDRKGAPSSHDAKQVQLLRAEQRAQSADGRGVSLEVKAFFARMIRLGGALPPEKP
jgi:hypothetical protein